MRYRDLYAGMKLICNQTNGEVKEMIVARKGIDGLGRQSVVFRFASGGQVYCKAEDVPRWYIQPLARKEIKLTD